MTMINVSNCTFDGKLRRLDGEGKNSAWYVAHESDGVQVVIYGDWKTGEKTTWCNKKERTEPVNRLIQTAKKEVETHYEEAAKICVEMWELCRTDIYPPYCEKKEIMLHGARCNLTRNGRSLYVPMRDFTGKLWGLQCINPDSSKLFWPGQKVLGTHFSIGTKKDIIYVTEGFATAASIHEATGQLTIAAFTARNLVEIAKQTKIVYPDAQIVIAGDDDQFTTRPTGERFNPGRKYATQAAHEIGAFCVFPNFKNLDARPTDFNDLFIQEGPEEIRHQLTIGAPPFPIEIIPEQLRDFVIDTVCTIQCPIEYVAYNVISGIGAMIGTKLRGKPLRNGNFYPPSFIWTLGLGHKGTAKSSALTAACAPLFRLDKETDEQHRVQYSKCKYRLAEIDEQIKAAKKNPSIRERLKEIEELENEKTKLMPEQSAWIIQDLTTASAIEMLKNSPRGLLVLHDELTFLFKLFSREHSADIRQLMLSGWNANQTFKKKLKSEQNYTVIRDFAVNIVGMMQPAIFQSLFQRKRHFDDGFLERFQLLYYPERVKPMRRGEYNQKPDQSKIKNLFSEIFHFDMSKVGKPLDDFYYVEFSKDAEEAYKDFDFEIQQKVGILSDVYLQGYYSKLPRTLCALSVIFYAMDYVDTQEYGVKLKHVELAKRWVEHTGHHARKVFAMI